MKSTFLSLGVQDFLKALIMAVVAPVLYIIQQSIAAGALTFNWHQIEMAAVAGAVGYLIKNYFSDSVAQAKTTLITEAKKEGSTQVVLNVPDNTVTPAKP